MTQNLGYSNPFLTNSPFSPAQQYEVPANAPEGTYTYALVKNAPDVPAAECEVAVATVEVVIRWGDTVLHVAHLTPPRSFYVGEAEQQNAHCDFFLPEEKLGSRRAPLVQVDAGTVYAVLLPGSKGTVQIGNQKMTIAEAISSGKSVPCAEFNGAQKIALPMDAKAKVELNGFSFDVATGHAGRPVAGRFSVDKRGVAFTALSFVLQMGMLGAMAVLVPPMALASEGEVTQEQRYLITQAINANAERELDKLTENTVDTSVDNNRGGQSGVASKGAEGTSGSQVSKNTDGHWGLAGPKDNQDVRITKEQLLRDAGDFGMIGILNAGLGGDPNALRAPWGDVVAQGNDPRTALGNMWGTTLGEAFGAGGLGLLGLDEGGGGPGEGVGVGRIGTIGRDMGFFGHGVSSGRNGRTHVVKSPRMAPGPVSLNGRIPPEIIQRTVRQNFGRFKMCYETGLRGNPSLSGRVAVGFVIGRDGAVSSVQNAGSDLPDAGVVNCVVRSFYGLAFPAPDVGIVTVTYPIMFTPGSN